MTNVSFSSHQFGSIQVVGAKPAIAHAQLDCLEVDMDEIDSRCKTATSGPWISYVVGRDLEAGLDCVATSDARSLEIVGGTVADQDFIAHAREDIPCLIAEVRRLRAKLNSLELRDSVTRINARGLEYKHSAASA